VLQRNYSTEMSPYFVMGYNYKYHKNTFYGLSIHSAVRISKNIPGQMVLSRPPWPVLLINLSLSLPSECNDRELKKLRRQLQGKRLIKTELCVKLSLLRLFHVDHVVQNRRSALSLACHEWFSCKGKEGKIYCCELPLSSKPQI